MVAPPGHLVDGSEERGEEPEPGDAPPAAFRQAVEELGSAAVRPEVTLRPVSAPRRIAPYAYALEADVESESGDEADGRLVFLHDPEGQESWRGTYRVVTLLRAELEPEMSADPLFPEVCWSWLTGALEGYGAGYAEPSGTVTRAASHFFGGLGEREPSTRMEIRASWTPAPCPGGDGRPDAAAHLAAWSELLCQCAGLPPGAQDAKDAGVVTLPQRRGPRQP